MFRSQTNGYTIYYTDEFSMTCIHGRSSLLVCGQCIEKGHDDDRHDALMEVMKELTTLLRSMNAK